SSFRDVGECAVSVVFIQCVAQRGLRIVEVTLAAVDQVNVHPTIVVVIEKSAAGPGCLRQIALWRFACSVRPFDAAHLRWNLPKRILRSGLRASKSREAAVGKASGHPRQELSARNAKGIAAGGVPQSGSDIKEWVPGRHLRVKCSLLRRSLGWLSGRCL